MANTNSNNTIDELNKYIQMNKLFPSKHFDDFMLDYKQNGNYYEGNYKGYKFVAKRNPILGNWCGYVDAIIENKFYDMEKETIYLLAYGGLTASTGFDCAHYTDYWPGKFMIGDGEPKYSYKNLEFVKDICCKIIDFISTKYPIT